MEQDGPPSRTSADQNAHAWDQAQQAAQRSGIQYNVFVNAAQARSVAVAAPSIAVPQLRIASHLLRGRDDLLEDLHDLLAGTSRVGGDLFTRVTVLYGMGGVGKTTLALEIAHRAISNHTKVWWIPADEADGMRAAFYALAFSLGARAEDFDRAHPADVLWKHLNSLNYPWLLVIDNADDPGALGSSQRGVQEGTEWLRPPQAAQSNIIVSSRNGRPERWASWLRMCHVPPLNVSSGAQVLMDLAPGAGIRDEAAALSAALGGVPLALELAGRYLASVATDPFPRKDSPRSFSAYRNTFDRRLGPFEMSAQTPGESPNDRRALTTTWEMSLDLLESQGHNAARPLLRLLSCCGLSPIPYRVIVEPQVLRRTGLFPDATPERIGTSLRALAGLGLVTLDLTDVIQENAAAVDEWGYRLTMHPLVRAVTRRNLQSEGRLGEYSAILAQTLNEVSEALDPADASEWPRWSSLAPHCFAALDLVTQHDPSDIETVRIALISAERAAWYRYMAGQYVQASADYRLILDVAERLLGSGSPEALSTSNNFARAVREGGDNRAAEQMLRSTLTIGRSSLGPRHPILLSTRLNLGRTLREAGQVSTAETELRDLLLLATDVLGAQHPDTIATALNLAVCLRQQERFGDAETAYRKALHDWRKGHSEVDLTTLDIRFELAETLQQQGDLDGAERELREVLAVATETYGETHPNTLTIRHGLATVLRASGRTAAADSELREVVRLKRGRLGAEHPLSKAAEAELGQ
ncbi:tetratricopeptide repeat protein [Streptosporangiaceae bacterium NEAU-GS5]|nr:tetratricopeptide repeat protein [Streptosporangiaceae bacterium NEAU-GS5]